MADVYETYVAGWVKGLAEDPAKAEQEFTRLNQEHWLGPDGQPIAILEPSNNPDTVAYWMSLLSDPFDEAWPGMYARTELSMWGR